MLLFHIIEDSLISFQLGAMKRSREGTLVSEPLNGYVTNVLPIKGTGNPYFDFKLHVSESPEDSVKVVGFSSQRRTAMKELQVNRTGVHLSNLKKSMDSTGKYNYLLSDRASIVPKQLNFAYPEAFGCPNLDLTSIDNIPIGDSLFSVTACVTKMIKMTQTDFRDGLKKQDVIIAKEGSQILLRLWSTLCDTIQVGKSYQVSPVKIRFASGPSVKYLTTTPNTEITPVDDIPFDVNMTFMFPHIERIITGKIISLKDVHQYLVCPTCSKAIPYTKLTDDDVAFCNHCKSSTLVELCVKSGSVVVNFKTDESKPYQVTIYKTTLDSYFAEPSKTEEIFTSQVNATRCLLRLPQMKLSINIETSKVITMENSS